MNNNESLTLKEFVKIIRKRILLIIFIILVSAGLGWGYYVKLNKPVYTSAISIIVGKTGDRVDDNVLNDRNNIYANMMSTFSEIASSNAVAQSASDKLNKEISTKEIVDSTYVSMKEKTLILEIDIKSETAERSLKILNAISESFKEKTYEIYPSVNMNILDSPHLVSNSFKSLGVIITIGLIIGIIISVGLSFLIEYFSSELK
jgi:capsular polysaccharide biosynthesis protein